MSISQYNFFSINIAYCKFVSSIVSPWSDEATCSGHEGTCFHVRAKFTLGEYDLSASLREKGIKIASIAEKNVDLSSWLVKLNRRRRLSNIVVLLNSSRYVSTIPMQVYFWYQNADYLFNNTYEITMTHTIDITLCKKVCKW